MARAIGIDLGTTYSAVAAVNDVGQPEILMNRDSERITPSVVLFQGDEVVVGSQARRSLATNPESVVQFAKRQMGRPEWRFDADSGRSYRAEEVSGLILRRLAEDAAMTLDEEVGPVVITVPAYFDDVKRQATRDAGKLAGLDVARVINEPTAAAVAFGVNSGEDGTVLVYDLGGGTFDVTLLKIQGREFEVLATKGDPNLGGFDWDNRLIQHITADVQRQGGPDISTDVRLLGDVRDRAEALKRNLSIKEQGKVHVTAGGVNFKVDVTRATFEQLTSDLLNRTEVILEMVHEDAGLKYSDIDRVLLVGGSTRMPMVKQLVKRVTGQDPQKGVNPDEVVALGAAVFASLLEPSPTIEVEIADVTAHSLGTIVNDPRTDTQMNSVIIPRNTRIPSREGNDYSTMYDDQTTIEVVITEGEDTDPRYVNVIGKTMVSFPPYPKDAPLRITMGYDIDGLIDVHVIDLTTGREVKNFEIDRAANMDRRDVERRAADLQEEVII